MSSTATLEPSNDHESSVAPPYAGSMAKNDFQDARQVQIGAGKLRLDALTIAGLTGTPHDGGTAARFFGFTGGAPASAQSPAGSDDTLGSIQDSSVGDKVCVRCEV